MKDNLITIVLLAGLTFGLIGGFFIGQKKAKDDFEVFLDNKDTFCSPSIKLMYKYWEIRR